MRRPSNNNVTLAYGAYGVAGYTKDSPHYGLDISFQPDPNIYAAESGTINFVGWMGTAGNAVELTGAGGRKWRHAHMQSFNVFQGQHVKEGQLLGVMGETGNWPDGSKSAFGRHLHLVLFINGNRVDPMDVLGSIGGRKTVDADDLNYIYQYGPLGRPRNPGEGEDVYIGKSAAFVINDHMNSTEGRNRAAARQAQADTANQLQAKVSELTYTIQRMVELESREDAHEAAIANELNGARERIAALNTELEAARLKLQVQPTESPAKPVITAGKTTPVTEPSKPKKQNLLAAILTSVILFLFQKKTK